MKKSILLWLMVLCGSIISAQAIEINTVEDLSALATNNESQNGYVGQTIDLKADLTITKVWRPIGTRDYPFRGTFKGNGHIISGLGAIAGTDGVGLFGYVGEEGVIEEVGIGTGHIKTMKNDECQYVGALVGRNNGTIRRCWNMATLEVNAIHVGGLVGQNSGTMEDCYNAGPILKAIDYIGGLVGTNTGAIRYCYNIGYAANGYGVVAQSTGTINDCYYDRQLYIQNPDATHRDPQGVTAMERSADMDTIFSARSAWQQMGDNYPILKAFQSQDAAIVSVASIDLTNDNKALADNHMNLLTSDFIVNAENGVNWAVTSPLMEQWVYPDAAIANLWRVAFPCRPTDVILQVSKNGNVREVYAFPKPVPDFIPGKFAADSFVVCLGETLYLKDIELSLNEDPSGGAGNYSVQLMLNYLDEKGEVDHNETLISASSWGEYMTSYNSKSWIPTEPGHYTLQRFAADEQCHPELISAEGVVPIFVPAELTPGKITIESDTLCNINQTITITSKEPAICEGTKISYYWKKNNVVLPNQNGLELVDYLLPTAGTFAFTRYAYNNACVDSVHAIPSDTVTVVVYNKFNEGSVTNREIVGCTVQDALDQLSTIYETQSPTGGKWPYGYQWMMMIDDGAAQPISGANQPDLNLSDAGLEDAHDYVIYRTVKDSYCQTDYWIESKGQVEIQIYSEITGGEIETKTIPADCIMPDTEGAIPVHIQSLQPAKGQRDDINIDYKWYMVVNDETYNPIDLEQHTEALDYELNYRSVQNNATYTFFRTATNKSCGGEEVRSEGETTLQVVIATNVDSTHYICESLFEDGQYTFYYPNAENPRQTHIFYKDDLQDWEFTDKLESGCEPRVIIRPVLTLAPKIQTDDIASICQDGDAGTLTIYFEMLEGEADAYNIELSESLRPFFDGEKYISGIMPAVSAGHSGAITVQCQRIGISGGDKIMNLQVAKLIDGQELCYSAMSEIVLNVTQGGYVLDKYGKVLFIDNNPKHPTDPKFIAYQWYKNGQPVEGATGQYYHEDGASLNGSYFADLFYFNGGREMILRTCPIEMENGTKRNQENATDSVSKRLENSQIIIQRGDAEYTILGSEL